MPRSFISVALLTVFAACETGRSIAAPAGPDPSLALPGLGSERQARDTSLFRYSPYSGFAARRRFVVRDAATWATIWDQFVGPVSPKPEAPIINFSTRMVLVATMGSRSTGGYGIVVDRVSMNGDAMLAVVRETSPGRSCIVTDAFTAPATAVVVPATSGDVSFREMTETRNC